MIVLIWEASRKRVLRGPTTNHGKTRKRKKDQERIKEEDLRHWEKEDQKEDAGIAEETIWQKIAHTTTKAMEKDTAQKVGTTRAEAKDMGNMENKEVKDMKEEKDGVSKEEKVGKETKEKGKVQKADAGYVEETTMPATAQSQEAKEQDHWRSLCRDCRP